jgi:hypothetical protein
MAGGPTPEHLHCAAVLTQGLATFDVAALVVLRTQSDPSYLPELARVPTHPDALAPDTRFRRRPCT